MTAGGFVGVDPDGLVRLGAALEAAAEELGRRAGAIGELLAAVSGPPEATAVLAGGARWCLAQREDVLLRAAGLDAGPAPAWPDLFGEVSAEVVGLGAAAWLAGSGPAALHGAFTAMRLGVAGHHLMPARTTALVVAADAIGNAAVLDDPDASTADRWLAGAGLVADGATIAVLLAPTPAGVAVVTVVGGVLAVTALWRNRDTVAEWAAAVGGAGEEYGAAADAALEQVAGWVAAGADGAAAATAETGADWADALDRAAGETSGWAVPLGATLTGTAALLRWGSAGAAVQTSAAGGAVAAAAGRAGDAAAAAGRAARRMGDWLDDRFGHDEAKHGAVVAKP